MLLLLSLTHCSSKSLSLFCTVTRETAIVGAFLSAGAVHGIATACRRGVIEECPCIASVNYREGHTTYLHTCNDNVEYAVELVKEFYNIEMSRSEVDLVKKWNYDLGYQVSSLWQYYE